ncbi:SPOR domain-containing protein [Capnocytophaga canimorsus]|uniref:Translation initiation factor IF-2 n=2 Tax=Capnocytophaga canimorsus TaxID=28188 RepID=F9YU62_CAPCC|nr:SPOR domain-containing protein [Capnocytophaga canimorsus]AEK24180.1 Translation initiation factor IF-2 [Capnocytophaga canimorsus Cc5]ATA77124.1 sporulation protein [Capnocytophaga canimorsus]ATA91718.1 sporulation protein [Capnocytophaga canimorsus]ATA93880.1 sporulation protein [Capnocytophaga canimorsus]AWL78588.1 sporulation protein [Capnocytophaga canimorsus]
MILSKNLLWLVLVMISLSAYSQNGITIVESENIKTLIEVKKEIAKSEKHIQIQIYNGNISGANQAMETAKSKFKLPASLSFETPNYKVRIGVFRTRLDAERQLVEVKKVFPAAFIWNPTTY